MLNHVPAAAAESGHQPATADGFGQGREYRRVLEHFFRLPGHPERFDGAPVSGLDQAQPGEPGVRDHPGHRADVLRPAGPDENDMYLRHGIVPILGASPDNLVAFDGRCIPAEPLRSALRVGRKNAALPPSRALSAGRLDRLGAHNITGTDS